MCKHMQTVIQGLHGDRGPVAQPAWHRHGRTTRHHIEADEILRHIAVGQAPKLLAHFYVGDDRIAGL